ncbi:unnamed protein product [Ilex paraguariensis]|uniref:Uncharacterized protein n=1 Tax=Ilex paraguariensis TaxID=185542 RepID=A0ABC8RD27_9AQUA
MAVLSLSENSRNKENIPPFSAEQDTTVSAIPIFPTKNKRRLRKPLEDITNFFYPTPIYSSPIPDNPFPLASCSCLVCKANRRKRRAEFDLYSPMLKNTRSVSLRKGFR